MAGCTLDLSHPSFLASLGNQQHDPETQKALAAFKAKVEHEHTSCSRVVQPFYGNGKFQHLHNKIWKYDWGVPGSHSSGRKSWRLVVVVQDPNTQPYRLVAGAIYSKSTMTQLSIKELAKIFAEVVKPISDAETNQPEFRLVDNGDGRMRLICCDCMGFEVSGDLEILDTAKSLHKCPPDPSEE
jgi:hypothetical protein